MKHENIGFPKVGAPYCKWIGCKNKTTNKSGECHLHQKISEKHKLKNNGQTENI